MMDHANRDPEAPASRVFYLLNDSYPTGKRMDNERATMKQLDYICDLAGLEGYKEPFTDWWAFKVHAQGHAMSKSQAGHIIGKLLEMK